MQGNAGKNALQKFSSLERQRHITVTVWSCHVERGTDSTRWNDRSSPFTDPDITSRYIYMCLAFIAC